MVATGSAGRTGGDASARPAYFLLDDFAHVGLEGLQRDHCSIDFVGDGDYSSDMREVKLGA